MKSEILLRNGSVYIEGVMKQADIVIQDGIITNIIEREDDLALQGKATESGDARRQQCTEVSYHEYDCSGCYVLPGLVDVHVHFREPGFEYKEDIATGSLAAAHGGYTDVCTMPNLNPVPDDAEHLKQELDAIREKALIHVYPYGSITVGENGLEPADLEGMSGDVIAFSDDGKGVEDDEMMLASMLKAKRLGKIIAAHCEDKKLMGGSCVHDGAAAKLLRIDGISSKSEWAMIKRDLELAAKTGCSYHVCHVSTKESIDIIKEAKASGIDVTCETGPHYLLLDEEQIVAHLNNGEKQEALGRFKMNPPLRSAEDRKALREAFLDGTVDMVATDHAPHSAEEKSGGLLNGPMGVTGLECAFQVMFEGFVRTGLMSLEELVEKMSIAPAKRFNIRTGIIKGNPADIMVFDPRGEYVIDSKEFFSKGKSTPFDGNKVTGRVRMTICDGKVVYGE